MRLLKELVPSKSYFILLIVLILVQQLFLYAKFVGFEKNEDSSSQCVLAADNLGGTEKREPDKQTGFINYKIEEEPELYVESTIDIWENLLTN